MNSTLQSLIYATPLQKLLLSQHHNECNRTGFCSLCALGDICKRLLNGPKPVAPKSFAFNLKKIGKQFRIGRQEDSHEFLRFLLDGIHEMYMPRPKVHQHDSPIQNIFGGTFENKITCLHCSKESVTIDSMMDVSLNIRQCSSIEQAFRKFTAPENLIKDNQYKCDSCKKLRDARKQTVLGKLPLVLTVQLKRFGYSKYGSKVSNFVSFPEILDVSPFTGNSKSPIKYQLFAVLVHSGSTCSSGHYYTHVKSANGKWYRMDDSSVSQINSATVLKQNAYLLFYEKIVDSKPKNQLKKDLVGEKPILPVKKIIEPIRPVETVPVKQVVPPEPLRIVKVTPVLQPDLPIKVNSTMKWSVQSVSPPERVQKEEISSNKPRTPEVGGNRNLPTKKSKSRFTDDHYDSKDEIVIPTELVLAETKSEPSIRNEKPKFEFKSPRKSFNGDFEATKNRCSNIEQPKLNFKDGAAAIANGNAKMIFSDFKPQKSKVQKDNRETLNGLSNSRPKFPAGNSFLDELVANSVQSNSVLPWGHLENSDIISNRKRIEEEMREKTRLKRPTKDDILYDAPKYKKKIKL